MRYSGHAVQVNKVNLQRQRIRLLMMVNFIMHIADFQWKSKKQNLHSACTSQYTECKYGGSLGRRRDESNESEASWL